MSGKGSQLSPHGTARVRLAQLFGEALATDALGELFRRLGAGARAHDLDADNLYLAEELVRLTWVPGQREQRALALLVLATLVAGRSGSTRLPLSRSPKSSLGRIIAGLAAAAGEEVDVGQVLRDISRLTAERTFDGLIGRPGEVRPLMVSGDCVYPQRMLWCEDELADRLRPRMSGAPAVDAGALAGVMADVVGRPAVRNGTPVTLSDEQQAAVRRAVAATLTVISGGPGTGKTAVVVSILRVLWRLGIGTEQIALAAPTGKAANRMAQAIRAGLSGLAEPSPEDEALTAATPEPRTLHRLLGYLPAADAFRHHDNNPLAAEVVIVDEASMVDLALMERLVRALRPSCRLVLLGDADQLPSVEAGAVLRDLADLDAGGESCAVRLTRSYRMDPSDPDGRSVLEAARAINEGRPEALLGGRGSAAAGAGAPAMARRETPAALAFRGAELLDTGANPAVTAAFVDHWYERHVCGDAELGRLASRTYRRRDGAFVDADRGDLEALLAHRERSRLLCLTRRQPTGAEAVNERLHERTLADSSLQHRPLFCPGEPVLMRANDYGRGLYNGDQGLVVRVTDDGGPVHLRAVFPRADGWVLLPLEALRGRLEHAFAMTIHKSQGSEYDHVAVILPARDLPLLTREMLYTAITRARRSAVLVGSPALIRRAARRPIERHSGLADKLSLPDR